MREAEPERRYASTRGLVHLWTGILLGPFAWAMHLTVVYALADVACDNPGNILFLSFSLVFSVVALAGGWFAWRNYKETGREWPTGDSGTILARSRFLAVGGLLLTGLTLLLILAQTIPMLLLKPCT